MQGKKPEIIFVSTPFTDPWSGAEELWARTAVDLVSRGVAVSACVTEFVPLHPKLQQLKEHGIDLWLRPRWYSLRRNPLKWLRSRHGGPELHEFERMIAGRKPSLVVFSEGNALPPLGLLESCISRKIPFVTIMHANKEAVWYPDDIAARYRSVVAVAVRCFFVSDGNRWLSEKQLGGTYRNAEIVRNPVNIDFDVSVPWPPLGPDGDIRFASVGRLYPPAKGQDALLEALSGPSWKDRRWKLHIYGSGNMRGSIEWLAKHLGIADRVVFPGFTSVEEIWRSNHVLVMPSRFEGLPLAIVEAMLCGRPVVATDVAGNKEVMRDGVTGFIADAPTAGCIDAALQRFWERRDEAEAIGQEGRRLIRELMPADPVRIFSDTLQDIVASTAEAARPA